MPQHQQYQQLPIKKISVFEIGEEKYNLSDKEQNENDHSAIKININHEQQKINNRKYLSRSDYSIINKKKKEEKVKNIFIKKLDIGEIKIENSNKKRNNINISERLNGQNNVLSNAEHIEHIEQYLLKNKINKNKRDKNYKMITNISETNLNLKNTNNIKISNSNIPEKKITRRLLSEKNINELRGKSKKGEEKKITFEKINQQKKYYDNDLKNKIIKKDNNPIKQKKEDNYIGDLLCSLFNAFDSKKDKKNEINIMKKENKSNNNNTQISLNRSSNKNIVIKNEKSDKKLNSSFIKINNKKSKIISLGLSNIGINSNNKIKKINIINTQPNIENKENNKNIINNKNIMRHYASSSNINEYKNSKKENKLKQNDNSKIIEIPVNSKSINKKDDYNNLNSSKIITPKKRYIFNRIHPFVLLGAFKKELTNYSNQNSKFNIKNN